MSSSNMIRIGYSDDDIGRRVSSLLMSQHFPAFRRLRVDVHNGVVTLSGKVYSYYEKQVAITSCGNVAGVLSLIDQIDVSDRPTRVDPFETAVVASNR
jgi:osmotically-inducible protein OsmY